MRERPIYKMFMKCMGDRAMRTDQELRTGDCKKNAPRVYENRILQWHFMVFLEDNVYRGNNYQKIIKSITSI